MDLDAGRGTRRPAEDDPPGAPEPRRVATDAIREAVMPFLPTELLSLIASHLNHTDMARMATAFKATRDVASVSVPEGARNHIAIMIREGNEVKALLACTNRAFDKSGMKLYALARATQSLHRRYIRAVIENIQTAVGTEWMPGRGVTWHDRQLEDIENRDATHEEVVDFVLDPVGAYKRLTSKSDAVPRDDGLREAYAEELALLPNMQLSTHDLYMATFPGLGRHLHEAQFDGDARKLSTVLARATRLQDEQVLQALFDGMSHRSLERPVPPLLQPWELNYEVENAPSLMAYVARTGVRADIMDYIFDFEARSREPLGVSAVDLELVHVNIPALHTYGDYRRTLYEARRTTGLSFDETEELEYVHESDDITMEEAVAHRQRASPKYMYQEVLGLLRECLRANVLPDTLANVLRLTDAYPLTCREAFRHVTNRASLVAICRYMHVRWGVQLSTEDAEQYFRLAERNGPACLDVWCERDQVAEARYDATPCLDLKEKLFEACSRRYDNQAIAWIGALIIRIRTGRVTSNDDELWDAFGTWFGPRRQTLNISALEKIGPLFSDKRRLCSAVVLQYDSIDSSTSFISRYFLAVLTGLAEICGVHTTQSVILQLITAPPAPLDSLHTLRSLIGDVWSVRGRWETDSGIAALPTEAQWLDKACEAVETRNRGCYEVILSLLVSTNHLYTATALPGVQKLLSTLARVSGDGRDDLKLVTTLLNKETERSTSRAANVRRPFAPRFWDSLLLSIFRSAVAAPDRRILETFISEQSHYFWKFAMPYCVCDFVEINERLPRPNTWPQWTVFLKYGEYREIYDATLIRVQTTLSMSPKAAMEAMARVGFHYPQAAISDVFPARATDAPLIGALDKAAHGSSFFSDAEILSFITDKRLNQVAVVRNNEAGLAASLVRSDEERLAAALFRKKGDGLLAALVWARMPNDSLYITLLLGQPGSTEEQTRLLHWLFSKSAPRVYTHAKPEWPIVRLLLRNGFVSAGMGNQARETANFLDDISQLTEYEYVPPAPQ